MLSRLRYLFVIVLVGVVSLIPCPVAAQGFAISGSFYRQHFRLIPGEKVRTPEIYIVVFNHEPEDIKVKLTPSAPPGVQIYLEKSEFVVSAAGEQRIEVGIETSTSAVPGEYILTITADIQQQKSGITVTGAAQQQARLSIQGEAGEVHIKVVDFLGNPFPAQVYCCVGDSSMSQCGFSAVGELNARMVPGEHILQAFYQDTQIARETFTLGANETKEITLVGHQVFIHGLSVVPNYYKDSKKVAFVNVVYTLKNIYQPLNNVKAFLLVSHNNKPIEKDEIISLSPLDRGSIDSAYKYVPAEGWQSGTYSFKVVLYANDKPCSESAEQKLEITRTILPTRFSWTFIAAVISGVLFISIVILIFYRRSHL